MMQRRLLSLKEIDEMLNNESKRREALRHIEENFEIGYYDGRLEYVNHLRDFKENVFTYRKGGDFYFRYLEAAKKFFEVEEESRWQVLLNRLEDAHIALLNTSIITSPVGLYRIKPIDVVSAQNLVTDNKYLSAIGHQSTCEVLSTLLGVKVELNRIEFKQKPYQLAIVLKMRKRAPEGVILSREEIEEIGYDILLLEREE